MVWAVRRFLPMRIEVGRAGEPKKVLSAHRAFFREICRRQDEDGPVNLVVHRIHLAIDAAAWAEALGVDQHLSPARLQAWHQPILRPLALGAALADEHFRHDAVSPLPRVQDRGTAAVLSMKW